MLSKRLEKSCKQQATRSRKPSNTKTATNRSNRRVTNSTEIRDGKDLNPSETLKDQPKKFKSCRTKNTKNAFNS